jgi:N-acetylated-alpha-linked acidic dipeptidase
VDNAVSGESLIMSSTPSLYDLIWRVTKQVRDPTSGVTLYDRWLNETRAPPSSHNSTQNTAAFEDALRDRQKQQKEQKEYHQWNDPIGKEPLIRTLGSGSDFVGFVDRVGVASMNFAFKGRYGVYHSNFDSFTWMQKFGDPFFSYVRAFNDVNVIFQSIHIYININMSVRDCKMVYNRKWYIIENGI